MYDVIPYPDIDNALINDLMEQFKKSGDNRNYSDFKKYTKKLAEYGLEMNEKYKRGSFKKLENDMYELRPTNFRIMFTCKDQIFYLLNGFFKKSDETPPAEKDLARKYIKIIHFKTK